MPCSWWLQEQRKKARNHGLRAYGLVRLAGIEPTTPWFVAKYSIQLSYSRAAVDFSTARAQFARSAYRVPSEFVKAPFSPLYIFITLYAPRLLVLALITVWLWIC